MSEEFLKKAKGSSGTSIIHSNNNHRNAAAAMMGMMVARSQEAGPYFHVSDHFILDLDSLAVEEKNIDSTPNQIYTDFKNDWVTYLRSTALLTCDLEYKDSCTPEENTIRFLNVHRRIPAIKPRTPHESRELSIPAEYLSEYKELVALIKAGGDMKPYLSRYILKKKADKNDGLLNSWGIQHIHFRQDGTDQLLFCVITEADVFMIQVLPHKAPHLWVDTQLFQILHNNWPELIARGKHSGLLPEQFSAAKRYSLRGYNANFPVTVSDGTVYLPPTGGTFASGESQDDWVNCKKIYLELDYWQSIINQNAQAIRAALNMPAAKKLVVRMAYDDRNCCFYEPTRGIRLGGFAS